MIDYTVLFFLALLNVNQHLFNCMYVCVCVSINVYFVVIIYREISKAEVATAVWSACKDERLRYETYI